MECPICFNNITKSFTTDCLHHFCQICIVKWCKTQTTCPKCREFITFLKPDPEFDQISYNFLSNFNLSTQSQELSLSQIFSIDISFTDISLFYINFSNSTSNKIGITLTNNNGIGVKIYKLSSDSLAFKSGLRVNQIILFINNIPCFNHKQAISIIEHNKILLLPIIFKTINI